MKPLISVIVPVYNQENYLAEAIGSILSQSFKEFELIIIDDGSTDGSAQIIKEYASHDIRIIPVFQANAGKPAAINTGVALAKAELLVFMDSDDVMLKDRLEKQYNYHLQNPEIEATSSHCSYINGNGQVLGTQRYSFLRTAEDCENARANGTFVQCAFTALTISKKAFTELGGLKSEYWPCDDFEFFNRLVMKGYTLVILPEVLMKYRLHASSITAAKPLFVYDMIGYIMHSINLQREGKPVISFEKFQMIRQKESWFVKFNRKRYNYAQIFFRNAGVAAMSKDYLNFIWQILAAAVLSPGHMVSKVVNLLK